MYHQPVFFFFFSFLELKSQSFGDSDKGLRNYVSVCLWILFKKGKKDEEDLITQWERLDQNDTENQRFIRIQSSYEAWQHAHTPQQIMESLSEISIFNESIRLWRKHGWNLKKTFRLHNRPGCCCLYLELSQYNASKEKKPVLWTNEAPQHQTLFLIMMKSDHELFERVCSTSHKKRWLITLQTAYRETVSW